MLDTKHMLEVDVHEDSLIEDPYIFGVFQPNEAELLGLYAHHKPVIERNKREALIANHSGGRIASEVSVVAIPIDLDLALEHLLVVARGRDAHAPNGSNPDAELHTARDLRAKRINAILSFLHTDPELHEDSYYIGNRAKT